jgi:O-acetyl-ADP-ribose deacetylase
VIHTVGPVYRGRPEDSRLLAACYTNSLALALAHGIRTLAFPAISCGVYGYPIVEASKIAVDTCTTHINAHDVPEKVIFTLFSANDLDIYTRYLTSQAG